MADTCVLTELPDSPFCAAVSTTDAADILDAERLLVQVTSQRESGGIVCNGQSLPAVPASRLDARLLCAARVFATDLARSGELTLVDSQGRDTTDRMRAAGYVSSLWGEAFAVEASTWEVALQRMLGSQTVCAQFAEPRLVDIGVAVFGSTYVITMGAERSGAL